MEARKPNQSLLTNGNSMPFSSDYQTEAQSQKIDLDVPFNSTLGFEVSQGPLKTSLNGKGGDGGDGFVH